MLGKKGVNVVWVVLGAVLVLAVASSFVRQAAVDKTVLKYQVNIEKLGTEMEQNLDRAIDTAIQEFATTGMSELDSNWYANHPFQPTISEVLESLIAHVEKSVNDFLDNLGDQQRDLTFTFSAPNVELGDPDPNQQIIDIKNLELTIYGDDKTQTKDKSRTYNYPYRWYTMYQVIGEWLDDDAGDLRNQIADLMDTECWTDSCRCGQVSFGPGEKGFLEMVEVKEEDVFTVVDNVVMALNEKFQEKGISGISCSYVVKGVPVTDSHMATEYSRVQQCIGSGTVENLHDEYFMTWSHQPELPNWEVLGFQWDNTAADNYRPKQDVEVEDKFINIHDVVSMERGDIDGQNPGGFVQWTMSVDKAVFLDMDIICADSETLVDTEKGTVPFEVEFGMILSMFLGCGNQEPLGQAESECWIGTCFPAGTQITMADGSEKNIEDVSVGDYVMSYDVDSGMYVPRQVLVFDDEPKVGDHAAANAELGNPQSLYTINDGLIEFTPEHPFYVREDGATKWAALVPNACQHPQKGSKDDLRLEVGQEILLDGEWVTIEDIGVSRYDIPDERVYNLMIDDTQTYIADGIVVHNKCFPPGTKVTMADGSEMNIEDVQVGDSVMTFNEATGTQEPGTVTNIETPIDDHLYVVNGGLIETTRDHPFYTTKPDGSIVWAAIDKEATLEKMPYLYFVEELEVGDSIMDEAGQWIAVESMDLKEGAFQVYNLLGITANPNFYANGFLVHNRNGGTPGTSGGGGGAGGGAG